MVYHIILVDILLIARIFPRPCGVRKNTTQLAKYPRVLYVKPSNKMYFIIHQIFSLARDWSKRVTWANNWGISEDIPQFLKPMDNKHNSLNLAAKICSDICPRTLSVPRSEQFSESEATSEAVSTTRTNRTGRETMVYESNSL